MFALALLAACSSRPIVVGSPIPSGVTLTKGRLIEARVCEFFFMYAARNTRYEKAYAKLSAAAGRDLITDVEVSESGGCAAFRARAVTIAPLTTAPAAASVAALAIEAATDPAFEKDTVLTLKPGAVLRTRPMAGAQAVAGAVPATVKLGARVVNGDGAWWVVSGEGRTAWVLEGDLVPQVH